MKALLLWKMAVSLLAVATDATSSPTPGAASWTDGMELEGPSPVRDADANWNQNGPLLQVPCGLMDSESSPSDDDVVVHPLATILDTSLSTSTVTLASLKEERNAEILGLVELKPDTDQQQQYIPAGRLMLRMMDVTLPAPELLVVESTTEHNHHSSIQLRLGLDWLRAHGAIMNLYEDELWLHRQDGTQAAVPFLRPRPDLSNGEL